MRLQEARERERAELLEQPFMEKQTINKALNQFEKQHGGNANEAEKKWNAKTEKERTWVNFKKHWKEEIHTWKLTDVAKHQGHHVDALQAEMARVKVDLSALQAENQSHQEENLNLRARQLQIQEALQAEQESRQGNHTSNWSSSSKTSGDDIGAPTEAVWGLVKSKEQPTGQGTGREQGNDGSGTV